MVPVVVVLPVRFQHLAGEGVDLIFIFHAVGRKLQFVNAVVQFIFPFREIRFRKPKLGQDDFLCFFQPNQPVGIQVVSADGNGFCVDVAGFDSLTDAFCHVFQEIIVQIGGTFGQLYHNVLFVSAHGLIEVPGFVNFTDQFADDCAAFFPLIILITGNNRFAVVILSFQPGDQPAAVVFDFDFGVDA